MRRFLPGVAALLACIAAADAELAFRVHLDSARVGGRDARKQRSHARQKTSHPKSSPAICPCPVRAWDAGIK